MLFLESEYKCATVLIFGILPDWLDALFEEIEVGVIFMCTRSFTMLVHCPEFLHAIYHSNWDQAFVEILFTRLMLVPEF